MANTYNGFSCTPAYYNFPAVDGSLARSLGAGPSGVQVNPFQAYQPPQIPQVPANYWSQIMSAQQSLMGGWSSFGGCQPQCPPQTGQQNHCPTQTSHQPPASEQHHCKGGHHEHGRTVINVDVHHYRCRDGETRTCGGPFSGAGTSASSVSQNFSAFGSQGGYSGFPSCGTSPFGGYSGSFGGGYEASYGGSYGGGYEASYGGGSYGGGYQGGYSGSYGGSQSSYGSYGSGSFGGYESSYGGYQSSYGGYQSSFGGYQSNSGGYQSSLGGYSPYGGLPNYGGALGSNYPQMQLQANPDYNSAFAGIRGLQTMSLVGSALSLLF